MTGFSEEKVRARALKSGAIGFLKKPFDDACLIECLDKALGGESSRVRCNNRALQIKRLHKPSWLSASQQNDHNCCSKLFGRARVDPALY